VFDEYRIEGKDDRNEIYIELNIDQLSRALKSALNSQVLKIKLTKKQGPCLTLEILQVVLHIYIYKILYYSCMDIVDVTSVSQLMCITLDE